LLYLYKSGVSKEP